MNKNFPFIDLSAQKDLIEKNIKIAIDGVLEHGKYILGPEVDRLEKALEKYSSVKNAVTCANGTDALSLALMAWDIGPNDAVFLPSFSYISTAEAPAQLGAVPFFVDVKIDTYNMCPDNLQRCIEKAKSKSLKPSVVIPVDLFGQPAEIIEIEKISKEYGMKTLIDSAQSFGASIDEKKVGSFGDATTTSFFPSKPLGCYGDGGAIFTNDDELAEKLKSLRFHGIDSEKQNHSKIGFNSRLDSIQAAILIEKLKIFENELQSRNKIAETYTKELEERFITPTILDDFSSSWAQYTIRTDNREKSIINLKKYGIPSMIYYSTPIHKQPAFKNYSNLMFDLSVTEKLSEKVLSIPMHPYLKDNDIEMIIKALNS